MEKQCDKVGEERSITPRESPKNIEKYKHEVLEKGKKDKNENITQEDQRRQFEQMARGNWNTLRKRETTKGRQGKGKGQGKKGQGIGWEKRKNA